MHFEEVSIEHTKTIAAAVSALGWASCQLAAAGLYCYAAKYKTEICVLDGNIYIKQTRPLEDGAEGSVCYFMPIPLDGGDIAGQAARALETLYNWHRDNIGGDFVIWGVADDVLALCGEAISRAGLEPFSGFDKRDWAEYMHTPENLVDMRGKRFHAKKNAVNQFMRNNSDFHYVPIDRTNIGEVAGFQERLLAGVRKFNPDKETVRQLILENDAIMRGLNSFEELNLAGGILRIDGEISAFAFGGAINRDCFDITFEKALRSYNGIFQVLEQEMLKSNISGYKYINREEDLGEPGLRFAKERLRPDILLMKSTFVKTC